MGMHKRTKIHFLQRRSTILHFKSLIYWIRLSTPMYPTVVSGSGRSSWMEVPWGSHKAQRAKSLRASTFFCLKSYSREYLMMRFAPLKYA